MQRRVDQIMKAQYRDRRLKPLQVQDQVQPQPQKCPRCGSLNTKFCYYNLSQPRYLCKSCRRYWTQGGTLRNVPVGGGCQKGKRAKQSLQSSNAIKSQTPLQIVPPSLTTSQHVIFSGTSNMTPSSVLSPGGELASSSTWVNAFGSSQGQCQIQAPEIIYKPMDQSSGKATLNSSSPAGWPENYITNSISNPMAAAGDAFVWKADNSNTASVPTNPTNNSAAINQWPDYMPGFCPPP